MKIAFVGGQTNDSVFTTLTDFIPSPSLPDGQVLLHLLKAVIHSVRQNRSYTNVTSSFTQQDYSATQIITFTISGFIRFVSGSPLSGVKVGYAGNQLNDSVFTNTDGFYTITVPQGWTGIVQPVKAGFTFYPLNYGYNNISQNFTNQKLYRISGNNTILLNRGGCAYGNPAPRLKELS